MADGLNLMTADGRWAQTSVLHLCMCVCQSFAADSTKDLCLCWTSINRGGHCVKGSHRSWPHHHKALSVVSLVGLGWVRTPSVTPPTRQSGGPPYKSTILDPVLWEHGSLCPFAMAELSGAKPVSLIQSASFSLH